MAPLAPLGWVNPQGVVIATSDQSLSSAQKRGLNFKMWVAPNTPTAHLQRRAVFRLQVRGGSHLHCPTPSG